MTAMRTAFAMIAAIAVIFGCKSSHESAHHSTSTESGDNFAFKRLETLCDKFGSRFSGSTNLEMAIDWIVGEMNKDGLENVHTEPVMVPHWVRGEESAELIEPRHRVLPMLGLGGSIATPAEG